ncbi:MAG: hypothetical protein JXB85_15680 [Anaerolineales bacterium]|nr:hypothetical protein [Anaerolineales bacterium]
MTTCQMGVDVGSTTAKVVILDSQGEMLFSAYRRHNAKTLATLQAILQEAARPLGDHPFDFRITGSAGLGISEKFALPFIQEVVASAEVVSQRHPLVRTLIDIGGEDAKMIFFDPDGRPDIRMNGSCAGGTGAFIDEMATLLNVSVAELDGLAARSTTVYPMASRCGVFAKTDLQSLLSREVTKENIAASVFRAVVLQTLATLARGYDPVARVLFSGGPLTFLPSLKNEFIQVLGLGPDQVLEVANAELLPALGAALAIRAPEPAWTMPRLVAALEAGPEQPSAARNRLAPLFADETERRAWTDRRTDRRIERVAPRPEVACFLGVDSGSTTTKVILIDEQGRVAFDHYANNAGNAIGAVREGLRQARQQFGTCGPRVLRSAVTGYGEDLIRAAFGFDDGLVETLAHFRAARAFDEKVTFILDIGGQDMKAIFVQDGRIRNIEINEACSSGCGSFLQSFARNMGYEVADFARMACQAEAPCDLGTRCTVFMNSRVKQALREGAGIDEISAGLAYSVIKNALHKVLKVTDVSVLGEHIVVQGGTFRNPAIQKALEHLLGRQVTCPDMAELMGAYGAALSARDAWRSNGHSGSSFAGLQALDEVGTYVKREIRCGGCQNRCAVTRLTFPNGNVFYSGNRCENKFTNGGRAERRGVSLPEIKYDLLFERPMEPSGTPRLTIGIPRVLNMFENFPFWNALFVECGLQVRLSAPSSSELYKQGAGHIMSENLCFPGKLVSGHILDLVAAGVDRIFYPMVFYEQREFHDAVNTYNCPIVSGYADVIRSAIDPERRLGVPFDMPPVTFADPQLLRRICVRYLTGLGVPAGTARRAFERAVVAQAAYKDRVRELGAGILEQARAEGRPIVLLLGRPYHIDPLINHKIPDLLTGFGVDIITEDAVPLEPGQALANRHVMTQWEYVNRYYHAARWAGSQPEVEVVQLNSFGCGPDAFILEEVNAILGEYAKTPTVIRIDEIESSGSVKLRLRSMIEARRQMPPPVEPVHTPRRTTKVYQPEDRGRTLLVPDFSPFCSPPITRPFIDMGYDLVCLPPADRGTVDIGLKYTNNEICYPGIVCIGDLVKALQSGEYDPSRTAIGFSQTGGQCRATSYPSMIKKALVAAGFADVPVVTLTTNLRVLNEQPGFDFDVKEYVTKAAVGMMFTDALSDMYHATAVREAQPGAARQVADRYLSAFMDGSLPIRREALLAALARAVEDFNTVPITGQDYPRVGIVGEIYVKYNAFSNNYVADWLMEQGLEVVMPTFMEFFAGGLVNTENNVRTLVKRADTLWMLALLGKRLIHGFLGQVQAVMGRFRFYHPHQDIDAVAGAAEEIVSLNHQYGEGWLIAGEIASFARQGVPNVLCLQPFGCIANHVVAKGVQKRLKERYPRLNLLFLDADAGVSEVNFFNRLHFFVNHARSAHAARA